MGLRCLIGHDYGEPQTSRDRRERGNEVVVTVTEYRECSRCGHTRVISENKEVKAGGAEPAGTNEAEASAEWASGEPGDPDQSTVEAFSRSGGGSAGGGHDEPMTAADDDGVILEDEPEEAPPRGHGEWPEAEVGEEPAAPAEEPEPWPDEEAAPDPEPAEPEEPAPPGPGEDPLEVGPEPTAEAAAEDDPEQTEIMTDDTGDEGAESGASSGGAEESPPPRPDNRNTEFVCPDCGETWPTRNASLRPGDICPECRTGYLDERVVQ